MALETKSTRDLWLAGYLLTIEGVDIEKLSLLPDGRTVEFVLSYDSENINFQEITRDYYNRKAQVDPRVYKERMDDLKDLLHNSMGLEIKTQKK